MTLPMPYMEAQQNILLPMMKNFLKGYVLYIIFLIYQL